MKSSPSFFIVGAPKCGTTALYEFLKSHPDIYMPDKKELEFFGSDLKKNPKRTIDEYLTFFEGWDHEKVIGEASVRYLYSKKAAMEIKKFEPNAKIIIMIRNPVDMLYSYHSQEVYNGNEDITLLSDALEAETERKEGYRIPVANFLPDALYYSEQMKLSDQIERYIDTFGSQNIHVIIYDEFKNDIENTFKKVLFFLNVDVNFTPEFKVVNPNKKIRSSYLNTLVDKQPAFNKTILKLITTQKFRQKIKTIIRNINTNYVKRKLMPFELREKLTKQFEPEVDKLSRLLNKDLRYWNKCDKI